MKKICITVATTGGRVKRSANPNLPEQPDDIAQATYECYNEGAAIVHIHARDPQGNLSSDHKIYREIHEKIRAKCDIIIQDTAVGSPNLALKQRLASMEAEPEMASLTMGTMVSLSEAHKGTLQFNPPWEIEKLAKAMLEKNIKPIMEVSNPSMLRDVRNIIDKGLLTKPYCINLVIGINSQGGLDPTPQSLIMMLDALPKALRNLDDTVITVTGIGKAHLQITTIGMLLGSHVRVGLEDDIYYSNGVLATNVQLVARAVRIARELGLEIASSQETREMLGVKFIPTYI